MNRQSLLVSFTVFSIGCSSVLASEFDVDANHARFMEAFNSRQWEDVRAKLADDIVFHRADATEVFVGPEAVVEIFENVIGAPDQWNVKFAVLQSTNDFVGRDGRVVERGDFAITAGADDGSCYRGSYIMTWASEEEGDWKIQMLTWQDVEADIADCS